MHAMQSSVTGSPLELSEQLLEQAHADQEAGHFPEARQHYESAIDQLKQAQCANPKSKMILNLLKSAESDYETLLSSETKSAIEGSNTKVKDGEVAQSKVPEAGETLNKQETLETKPAIEGASTKIKDGEVAQSKVPEAGETLNKQETLLELSIPSDPMKVDSNVSEILIIANMDVEQSPEVSIGEMPDCAEKTLQQLYVSIGDLQQDTTNSQTVMEVFARVRELISKLKGQLQAERLSDVLLTKLNSIESTLRDDCTDFELLKNEFFKMLREIQPLDMDLMLNLIKQTDSAAQQIKDKNVILLLGVTGSGKSTTIHFLAGSEMERVRVDGLKHIRPKSILNPKLQSFVTSPFPRSETKSINAIEIEYLGTESSPVESLILCDTPGFGDTDGVETDIANGIGVVRAVRLSHKLKPVILISGNSIGDRWEGVTKLSQTLIRFVSSIEVELPAFSYVFTKYSKDDAEDIHAILKYKLEHLTADEAMNDAFVAMLKDMVTKTATSVIVLDPLRDNPQDLLSALVRSTYIENPRNVFTDFVTPESMGKLSQQLSKQKISILQALHAFDANLLKYKIDQLYILNHALDLKEIRAIYEDCVKDIEIFIHTQMQALYEKIDTCLLEGNKDIEELMAYSAKNMFALLSFERIRKVHLTDVTSLIDSCVTKLVFAQNQLLGRIQGGASDTIDQAVNLNTVVALDKMLMFQRHVYVQSPLPTHFDPISKLYNHGREYLLEIFKVSCQRAENALQTFQVELFISELEKIKFFVDHFTVHFDTSWMQSVYEGLKNNFILALRTIVETASPFFNQMPITLEGIQHVHSALGFIRTIVELKTLDHHFNRDDFRVFYQKTLDDCLAYFQKTVELVSAAYKESESPSDQGPSETQLEFSSCKVLLECLDQLRMDSEVSHLTSEIYFRIVNQIRTYLTYLKNEALKDIDLFVDLKGNEYIKRFLWIASQLSHATCFSCNALGIYNQEFETLVEKLRMHLANIQEHIEKTDWGSDEGAVKIESTYCFMIQIRQLTPIIEAVPVTQTFIQDIEPVFFEKIRFVLKSIKDSQAESFNVGDYLLKAVSYLQAVSPIVEILSERQAAYNVVMMFLDSQFQSIQDSLSSHFENICRLLDFDHPVPNAESVLMIEQSVQAIFQCLEKNHQWTILYQQLSILPMFGRKNTVTSITAGDTHVPSGQQKVEIDIKTIFYHTPIQLMQKWTAGEEAIFPKQIIELSQTLNRLEQNGYIEQLYRMLTLVTILSRLDPFLKVNKKYTNVGQGLELAIRQLNDNSVNQLKLAIRSNRYEEFTVLIKKLDRNDPKANDQFVSICKELTQAASDLTESIGSRVDAFEISESGVFVESLKSILRDLKTLKKIATPEILEFLQDENLKQFLPQKNKDYAKTMHEKIKAFVKKANSCIEKHEFHRAEQILEIVVQVIRCLDEEDVSETFTKDLSEYVEAHKQEIQKQLDAAVSAYNTLDFSTLSKNPPIELFRQLKLAANDHVRYADAIQRLKRVIEEQVIHFLKPLEATEAIDEGEEKISIIESLKPYFPEELYALFGETLETSKKHLQVIREKAQRELNEDAVAEKMRELVQKLVDYSKRCQFGLMADARVKINELMTKGSARFRADLAKGDLVTVFENLPKVWADWVYYSTQLGILTLPSNPDYASRHRHLYQDERCIKLCSEILDEILKTIGRCIEDIKKAKHNDSQLLAAFVLHFDKFVFFLRLKKESPVFYANLLKRDPNLPSRVQAIFVDLQGFLKNIQAKFEEKLKADQFAEIKELMNAMKEQASFFKSVQDCLSSQLFLEETPAFREAVQGFLSYMGMKELLTKQVLKWKDQCTREKFLHHERTKTANASDRDSFYQEVYVNYKHLKQVRHLAEHVNTGTVDVHVVEADCETHIEKEINQIAAAADELLDKIPSTEPRVYADYNVAYDNLRSMASCFEDSRLAQIAKGKITELDRKFGLKIRALRDQAWNETSPEKTIEIFITLKTIAINIPVYKKKIDESLDDLLLDFKKQPDGSKKVAILCLQLKAHMNHGIAKMLIAEHTAFRGYVLALRNEKTLRFKIDDVLDANIDRQGKVKGLQCRDYTASDPQFFNRENLREHYRLFDEEYWSLVEPGLINLQEALQKILVNAKMIAEGNELDKLRRLIAHVFAYWTLSNAQYFSEAAVSGLTASADSSKNYLMQPHVAQVVAIFRLFSIDQNTPAGILSTLTQVAGSVAGNLMSAITTAFSQTQDQSGHAQPVELNLSNHLIQVPTGEGKSVVLAVTATVLGLLGYDVNCACYSEYLSRRDYEDFLPIFNAFSVNRFISYGTFNQMCEDFINEYGNVRLLVEETIRNNSIARVSQKPSYRPKILLIDEVDVFFNKDFYGNTYQPMARLSDPIVKGLTDYIWGLRKDSKVKFGMVKKSDPYIMCCRRFPGWSDLIEESVKAMLYDLQSFESQDYIVRADQIGYKDQDGISFTLTYGYKTLFAYYKERELGNISQASLEARICLLIDCGSFSYAEMPKQYRCVMGVTGTLETLSRAEIDLLKDIYGIKRYSYIPSVYGINQLQFFGDSVRDVKLTTKDRYFSELRNEINLRLQGNIIKRAILVFFESTVKLEEFYNSSALSDIKDSVKLMTEKVSVSDKEGIIRQAASSGSITLLTRKFGRGTDFICYDDTLIASGGVHVIQTFVSDEISEETQIKGRTARQGNTGSFSMVLVESELERFCLRESNLQQMKSTGKLYDMINQFRCAFFDRQYAESMRYVDDIKTEHSEAQVFLKALITPDPGHVKTFLLKRNKLDIATFGTDGSSISRTVVLMDATGSMSNLISKAKHTVKTMFERAYCVLKDAGNDSVFELQFVAYRNYNAEEESLLQVSPWELKPDNLRIFIDSISSAYGMGNEAIEIGLWHVNQESCVSQVILIGDQPPNTRSEVEAKRMKRGETYWSTTKYREKTFYEDELLEIQEKNIPVHAFFVDSEAKQKFTEIANKTGGRCEALDINSDAGAEMLTHLVTEQIMDNIGGARLVSAYREKFRRGYISIESSSSQRSKVNPNISSDENAAVPAIVFSKLNSSSNVDQSPEDTDERILSRKKQFTT